ncbi:CAF17-like 4Fe-4S cluster assembly/insertion protein YgfZ [Demequina lignilytica]|uniref:Glycine cleavage T C-terminal barrel domain-containing protein n=1 Tax=Demequina lignilytica TaxID=3051663 RepID=A0AB35MKC3_9MICO|nr:glycine cleavage T C-terminal barrel domain-containing protein [Demequina sp. SYSU T0a273]MDN4484242.1 glycine cleavage T C-terminal barrel domain-containing protein [Demequina sp. SYSU T0a273]
MSISPTLARHGAVPAEGPDAGVAWHYGDPTAEQRALEAGRAVVDQSHLGVVTVTGPDRLSWLNSLCTQEVAALAPGVSTEIMILSPQGRIEHVAGLIDDGTTAWLLTESAPALATFLDRMRFMLRVEVDDATRAWAAIGEAVSRPAADGEPVTWVDPWPRIAAGGTTYAASPADHPGATRAWRLVLVPRDSLADEIQARLDAGWTLAGTWATEAIRIAAHRPRAAAEIDATTLPHELDWLRTAVHLHKGCYRGQETVAKVHNVGRPPRRLTLLHLDGSSHEIPAAGADVLGRDGAVVGHVTSAARHHELGPIALAVLKRSVDPSMTLTVPTDGGPVAAAQELIVNADGFSADRPPKVGPTMKGLLMGKGCAADGGDLPD